jgi:hypothetical protein
MQSGAQKTHSRHWQQNKKAQCHRSSSQSANSIVQSQSWHAWQIQNQKKAHNGLKDKYQNRDAEGSH